LTAVNFSGYIPRKITAMFTPSATNAEMKLQAILTIRKTLIYYKKYGFGKEKKNMHVLFMLLITRVSILRFFVKRKD
jgi:hypothetical protein